MLMFQILWRYDRIISFGRNWELTCSIMYIYYILNTKYTIIYTKNAVIFKLAWLFQLLSMWRLSQPGCRTLIWACRTPCLYIFVYKSILCEYIIYSLVEIFVKKRCPNMTSLSIWRRKTHFQHRQICWVSCPPVQS